MTESFPFPELETDEQAIAAFRDPQTARTEAAFCDAAFDADVRVLQDILEDDSHLHGLIRRGDWIYNFLRNPEHPKGLWRRLPLQTTPSVDADWQTVFDLDAFCSKTGEDWHWRGAQTAFFDAEKLLVTLSWQGSDQTRYLEWDAASQTAVEGGFDLGPERSNASWIDADTVFYGTSTGEGAATRSGWPGRVLRLSRGMDPADAPVAFEVDHEDLMGHAYALPNPDGSTAEMTIRARVIGDNDKVLHPQGIGQGPAIPLDSPRNAVAISTTTHFAYVAADDGPDPAGTLVLRMVGQDVDQRRILFTPEPYVSVDPSTVVLRDRWMTWVERNRMEPTLRVLDLHDPTAQPVTLALPCDAQSVWVYPHDAAPVGDGPYQMTTTGFLTPSTTWVFDLDQGPEGVTYSRLTQAPATFDADGMEVRLHSAISDDGTEVPYHIVLPKDPVAPFPVFQYAYGGFGISMSPSYCELNGPIWLAQGGAYVLAYIRGGREFGADWHLAAKGHNRNKAFEDFAAIASDLVTRGYSTADKIGCHGGSNGGLLCSVMLTRYPERFGASWPAVAVTDMVRYHLFPAGAGWMDEYGDPDKPEDRANLLSYSPVHNVRRASDVSYPPALITTNHSDDRVDPSHSLRLAAELHRAGQPTWFHSTSGGHGGGGATTNIARSRALGYAFMRRMLKL